MTKKEFKKRVRVGDIIILIWDDDIETTAIVLAYSHVREKGDISVRCLHSNGSVYSIVHSQIIGIFTESNILQQLKELEDGLVKGE